MRAASGCRLLGSHTRVALVTGGMGGLGGAICVKLAALGYTVVTTCSPGKLRAEGWLREMRERGWGRIINISSVNGQKGAFGQTNYAAAKAGMHGFTKSLALEVARKGVTVNTISPGYIGTKMVMAIPREVLDSKIIPQIPMGRLGKPEEVAGLVAYLPERRQLS